MIDEALHNKRLTWRDMANRVGCVIGGKLLAHADRDPDDFNPSFPDLMEGLDSVGLGYCGHKSITSFIRVVKQRVEVLSFGVVVEKADCSRSTVWRVCNGKRFTTRIALEVSFACGIEGVVTYQQPRLRIVRTEKGDLPMRTVDASADR